TLQLERHFRNQGEVHVLVRYRGAGHDKAGMPAHELYQSHAVVHTARFGMRGLENFGRFLNRGEMAETARNKGHVVIDCFRNAYDGKGVTGARGLLKKLLSPTLSAVPPNGE